MTRAPDLSGTRTPQRVKDLVGGVWLSRPSTPGAPLARICLDTRTLSAGDLFIALRGERFDAHDLLHHARAAALILVERDLPAGALPPGVPVLKVHSTRRALGHLAHAHRAALRAKVVGVGGSNGKTTTVRLIDSVLRTTLRGRASLKSHNNDIGVPLTLLSAEPTDQYLVVEIGTNHPGEIASLGALATPDIAVITSIGREHLEFLGSIRGVIAEEGSLLECIAPGGLGVVPASCPELLERHAATGHPAPLVTFGATPGADLRLTSCTHQWLPGSATHSAPAPSLRFTLNAQREFSLPLVGRHNALNALAAIAVARRLGLDDAAIARGLATAQGPEMRWQRRVMSAPAEAGESATRGIEVINDAYNANPDSTTASITTFAELYPPRPGSRRVIVLGDMLELGEHAPPAHDELGALIARLSACDLFIGVGPHAARAVAACQAERSPAAIDVRHLAALDDASATAIARDLRPGDTLLLKGSRGLRLERIEHALEALHALHAPRVTTLTPPSQAPVNH